jgi:hypothetical protein
VGLRRFAFLWCLLGLALIVWGSRAAARSLARDSRFFARPALQGATGPAWGGREVLEPVLARLDELGPVNLFDPDFESRIENALVELPGIARVDEIRRLWPNRYAVSCTLRRPCAVVRHGERLLPVTAQRVVLPLEPYLHAVRKLPVIMGLEGREAPAPGTAWESERLADGIATVAQLAPHAITLAPLGIHTVDVSEADDPRMGVVLRGADDIVVRWGRPRAKVGENSVGRKLSFIQMAAERIDQVRGYEIDVRWGAPYLRPRAPQE